MWLASVLRDQTLDFLSRAFANTLMDLTGNKKKEGLHFKKYFHYDSAWSGLLCL